MSVALTYNLQVDVLEDPDFGMDFAADPTITHTIPTAGTLSGVTTPPVTKVWSDRVQLTAGTLTLDLTALSRGSVLSAVDFTGLKVQVIKFFAASANTGAILIAKGASNGYSIFNGNASAVDVSMSPGETKVHLLNESLPDVGSGAKTITLTSSDVDAIISIMLVAG